MGGSDLINNRTSRQQPSSTNPEPWVDEHCDRLYRYALVRVCVPEVAEDLVQETLLAAVRSRENSADALQSEAGSSAS